MVRGLGAHLCVLQPGADVRALAGVGHHVGPLRHRRVACSASLVSCPGPGGLGPAELPRAPVAQVLGCRPCAALAGRHRSFRKPDRASGCRATACPQGCRGPRTAAGAPRCALERRRAPEGHWATQGEATAASSSALSAGAMMPLRSGCGWRQPRPDDQGRPSSMQSCSQCARGCQVPAPAAAGHQTRAACAGAGPSPGVQLTGLSTGHRVDLTGVRTQAPAAMQRAATAASPLLGNEGPEKGGLSRQGGPAARQVRRLERCGLALCLRLHGLRHNALHLFQALREPHGVTRRAGECCPVVVHADTHAVDARQAARRRS